MSGSWILFWGRCLQREWTSSPGGKSRYNFPVGIGDESYFPHWSAGIWSLLAYLKLLVSPENSAKDDGKKEFSFLVWIKLWKFAENLFRFLFTMSEEFWNFLKRSKKSVMTMFFKCNKPFFFWNEFKQPDSLTEYTLLPMWLVGSRWLMVLQSFSNLRGDDL